MRSFLLGLFVLASSTTQGFCVPGCLMNPDADLPSVLYDEASLEVHLVNTSANHFHIVRSGEIPFVNTELGPDERRIIDFGLQPRGTTFRFAAYKLSDIAIPVSTTTCTWHARVTIYNTSVFFDGKTLYCGDAW
jgi:hypothetical protein